MKESLRNPPWNVLFLCTGNSARSILAEALLNRKGTPRFVAYSAGSRPAGSVNPGALRQLEAEGLPTTGARSKSWVEFAGSEAPPMDFIVTVCDNAAGETCPVWPGHPIRAHWGIPDPAAVQGSPEEVAAAFRAAYQALDRRITAFLHLPIDQLDPVALQGELESIGVRETRSL